MPRQASGNRKEYTFTQKTGRWFKYKYLLLLRAKGGPSIVAKGFAVGLFVEMFTFPTLGLAALLILPIVYFLRASLPGAVIGFLFGKIVYLAFLPLNKKVGGLILPRHFVHNLNFDPVWLANLLKAQLKLIVGGIIVGAILGLVIYFPIKLLLQFYASKRKEKRRKRKAQLAQDQNHIQ
jgi:uncharacterized protein